MISRFLWFHVAFTRSYRRELRHPLSPRGPTEQTLGPERNIQPKFIVTDDFDDLIGSLSDIWIFCETSCMVPNVVSKHRMNSSTALEVFCSIEKISGYPLCTSMTKMHHTNVKHLSVNHSHGRHTIEQLLSNPLRTTEDYLLRVVQTI